MEYRIVQHNKSKLYYVQMGRYLFGWTNMRAFKTLNEAWEYMDVITDKVSEYTVVD